MSQRPRGRRPVHEITEPQRRTLKEIRLFTNRRGFPPTMKELADILGISHTSAHGQVSQLVRKGYLKREARKARGIVILRDPEDDVPDLVAVPIVGGFHDGTRPRNLIAYYGDGAGTTCAFSDDGLTWDTEKKVTGIAANGYHVVCALETAKRLRILYWNPDVPNQPYVMAGLRTAVCDPTVDPAAFTVDTPCAGDLVTEGSAQVWNRGHYGPSFLWYNPLPTSGEGRPFTWRYAMYFIASTGGNDSLGLACSDDAVVWKLFGNGPILSGLIDPQPWEGANGYVSSAHVERLDDGRWWMLYSGGSAGNAGIGYAWSWDRVHWRKAELNPVFKNGSGPFLERCYTPSVVRDADGSLLLYRAAKDATAYRTFVSRLRAPALGWRDLLGPDRLSQGLTSREAVRRGVGTQAERDAAIPTPSMGDEWFNTDLAGGGKWEKHTGTIWKQT